MIFEKDWSVIGSNELADRLSYALSAIRKYTQIERTPGLIDDRIALNYYNENNSEFLKKYLKRYNTGPTILLASGIIIGLFLLSPVVGSFLITVIYIILFIAGGFNTTLLDRLQVDNYFSFPISFIICFGIEMFVVKYMVLAGVEKLDEARKRAQEDADWEIKDIKKRVEDAEKKQTQLIDRKFLYIINYINEDYWYEDAISSFINYLRQGRVSTLSEAYALYEQERDKDELTELHNYSQRSTVFDMTRHKTCDS